MMRKEATHTTASIAAREAFKGLFAVLGPAKPEAGFSPEAILAFLMLRVMIDDVLMETTKEAFDKGCEAHPMEGDT